MDPLVSVMIPCYNAAATLPFALASLVAQTYEYWECLVVDDGSNDHPLDIVNSLHDSRFVSIRLDRNQGRGAARLVALDRASGAFLCMLDADDWIYPTKIERQVAIMRRTPEVDLVGGGMAIVDRRNDLVGVRCRGSERNPRRLGPVARPSPPPVAFGPSMLRMKAAKETRFDTELTISEDNDYLIKFLMSHRYCVTSDVSYVYSEHASLSREKLLSDFRLSRRVFARYRRDFPFSARLQMGRALAKELVYRGAFAVGRGTQLIERRSDTPSASDLVDFLEARRAVAAVADRLFPNSGFHSMPTDTPRLAVNMN